MSFFYVQKRKELILYIVSGYKEPPYNDRPDKVNEIFTKGTIFSFIVNFPGILRKIPLQFFGYNFPCNAH